MRSKRSKIVAYLLIVTAISPVVITAFLLAWFPTNENFAVIAIVYVGAATIFTSVGLFMIKDVRSNYHETIEVSKNLHSELKSIEERLEDTYESIQKRMEPLHCDIYESLKATGKINAINPEYQYEVQRVYWMVKQCNELDDASKREYDILKEIIGCVCDKLNADAKNW